MFVIDEGMKKFRKEIDRFNGDPNHIPRIRAEWGWQMVG